jgi:hypothetical protein
MQRNRQRESGRQSLSPGERYAITQTGTEEGRTAEQEKQQGLQDRRPTKQDLQLWGSCCKRQCGGGRSKAIISGANEPPHLLQALLLLNSTPRAKLLDAHPKSTSLLDLLLLAVEPESVSSRERRVATRRRSRSQVILIKSDRQGRVGRQNELCVALSPVPERGQCVFGQLEEATYLMQAMLTGAVDVAVAILYEIKRVWGSTSYSSQKMFVAAMRRSKSQTMP